MGLIGKPHGVRGGMYLWLHNPLSDLIDRASTIVVESPDGTARASWSVRNVRPGGKGARVLQVAEVSDREMASAHRGWRLVLHKSALPTIVEPGEFYYHELPGYAVETTSGRRVGTVRRVVETHVDVLEIDRVGGGELLVPVIQAYVLEVDAAGRRVLVPDELESWFEDAS